MQPTVNDKNLRLLSEFFHARKKCLALVVRFYLPLLPFQVPNEKHIYVQCRVGIVHVFVSLRALRANAIYLYITQALKYLISQYLAAAAAAAVVRVQWGLGQRTTDNNSIFGFSLF